MPGIGCDDDDGPEDAFVGDLEDGVDGVEDGDGGAAGADSGHSG